MPLTVVVIGVGQMGRSHALAYHQNPGFTILGLVNRSIPNDLPPELQAYPLFTSVDQAPKSDIVCIATHTDSHAALAITALESGSHVFIEKPLAATVEDAERVVATARRTGKKLMVGYILRQHPSWINFIQRARELGPPFVMRMNLNQQSRGAAWGIQKRLLETTSPIVDCGVHYLDVMLQITDSKPVQVRGMGVRLSEEIVAGQVNYGHLQVLFEDGSVGWYEAGWGPMISETAYFVKDVMGPKGSVSIVAEENKGSADVEGHTRTSRIKQHWAEDGRKEVVDMEDEPGHQGLCDRQQQAFLGAIIGDKDLEKHMLDAVRSLRVVLAADLSMKENRAVDL